MSVQKIILGVALVFGLSACLDNDLERAAAGALVGAVAAEATGGDAVTGAAIGGAAGALCNNVTNICK